MSRTIISGLTRVVILTIGLLGARGSAQVQQGLGDDPYIDLAQFRPDRPSPEYSWSEGWSFPTQFFPEHSVPSGAFHIYVDNPHDRDLLITGIKLNGRRLEELHEDLTVAWWRVLPNPIAPGQTAEVIVRMKGVVPTESEFVFEAAESASFSCSVQAAEPALEIAYVAFSRRIDRLHVYVHKTVDGDMTLSNIYLDGDDVTESARFYPRDRGLLKDLSLIELTLSEPLRYGSYHLIKVTSAQGNAAASMIRALDDFYSIGMFYGSEDRQVMLDQKRHLINTVVGLHLPMAQEMGLKAVNHNFNHMTMMRGEDPVPSVHERVPKVRDRPELFAHLLFDEPDVRDAYRDGADGTGRSLGYYALPMERATAAHREVDPNHPTLLVVDNTYKPDNWYVYGEIADILSTDPYGTADVINPGTLSYVVQSTETAAAACAPRPLIVILQAFYNMNAGFERMPDRIEERIMAYYAVGSGAKGIHYFWYPSEPPKLFGLRGRPLWDEVGRINAELQLAAPLLSMGYPIAETVSTSEDGLWHRALLCGRRSVIITLVNETYEYEDWRSDDGRYDIDLLEGVEVAVEVPPWMEVADVFEFTHQGPVRLPHAIDDGRVRVSAGEVDSGKMIVVTQDSQLFDERMRFYRGQIEPLQRQAASAATAVPK